MPRPKPPTCEGCPAQALGRGYVPGEGPAHSRIAFIGQGPGESEYHTGRPFIGPSGDRFNSWLAKAGIQRSAVWVDNIVRCWLPDNRKPTPGEVAHCTTAHLLPTLHSLPAVELLITVGLTAADWALARPATMDDAGTVGDIWLPSPLPLPPLDTEDGVA